MIKFTQAIQFVAIALLLEATTPFANSSNLNVNAQEQSQMQSTQERSRPKPPPQLAAAAKKLGITEDQLVEALAEAFGLPPKPPELANGDRPPQGCMPPPPPLDIKGAAQKLNVSEAEIIKALNLPPHPPSDRPKANL